MKHSISIFDYKAVFFLLLCLPQCTKLVDWGKGNFNQGNNLESITGRVRQYIRSTTVYDQFATRAKFDVLWLSDAVRTSYSELHARKYGKNTEQKNIFLRRQLEENKHYLSFYVLSLYEIPLGDIHSQWSAFLHVNGKNYLPIEVTSIDLTPEHIQCFGTLYTRFKVAYEIKFDARDIEENIVVSPDVSEFSMIFRAVDKEAKLSWNVVDGGVV